MAMAASTLPTNEIALAVNKAQIGVLFFGVDGVTVAFLSFDA
jgi:hypothetical protein